MSAVKKHCMAQCTTNKTWHEIWITEGWPYGHNRISVCKKCGSKYSEPAGEEQ